MSDLLNLEYACKCRKLEEILSPEAKELFYELEYIREQIYLKDIEELKDKKPSCY